MKSAEYLDKLEKLIVSNRIIKNSHTTERQVKRFEAYLKVRLTLVDNSILDVTEYIYAAQENKAQVKRYSYHWMDSSNQLRLRWDNVRHYPQLPGYPHHLHDRAEKNVVPSKPMTLSKVLRRIALEIKRTQDIQHPEP